MKLGRALNASFDGLTVISNTGKRYTPEHLQVKKLGSHASICNQSGMTESERKGEWNVLGLRNY